MGLRAPKAQLKSVARLLGWRGKGISPQLTKELSGGFSISSGFRALCAAVRTTTALLRKKSIQTGKDGKGERKGEKKGRLFDLAEPSSSKKCSECGLNFSGRFRRRNPPKNGTPWR